jgi:neurofibromin 1
MVRRDHEGKLSLGGQEIQLIKQDADADPTPHTERGRTQKDLDHACLRTLVVVTNGLVLRSTTETAEATPIVVRARLFQKYLALLIRALERATVTDVS